MEYIYLVKEKQYNNLDVNIYKIGRTTNIENRKKAYGCEAQWYGHWLCYNSIVIETKIIENFNKVFGKPHHGNEAFEGDLEKMIQIISYITNTKIILDEKEYISHIGNNDKYQYTNFDDFYKYAINNSDFLINILKRNFEEGKYTFPKEHFKIKQKKTNNIGRNPEKYPIPTTECERRFCILNPMYRCKCINKIGVQCSWIINNNGVCENCYRKGLSNNDISESLIKDALTAYKKFRKKKNWTLFVEKYYINNIFNEDTYNIVNNNINSKSIIVNDIKKKQINHKGRDKEKYPIPTTEAEKRFCLLYPYYRCRGIKKSGQCIWLGSISGFCGGCIKKNIPVKEFNNQECKDNFKLFKKGFNKFVEDYYINGIFNEKLYNIDILFK